MASLVIYIVSLATSAGIVGVYGRQVLGELGFVAGFRMEFVLAGGVALAYVAVQLAYAAALGLLYPTRDSAPLLTEALSNAAAVVFVPFLLGIRVPWPHPLLFKVEPMLYLGLFGAPHAFLKLATFYAVLRARPSSRLRSLGWAGAAGVAGLVAFVLLRSWLDTSAQGRPESPESPEPYRVGATFAYARAVPEGAEVTLPINASAAASVSMRWANVPPKEGSPEPLQKIYAKVSFEGGDSSSESNSVTLNEAGWAELQIPADHLPDDVSSCTVSWSTRKEPEWQKYLPVQPVVRSNRAVLLAGPVQHEQRGSASEPNFVVVMVEGLGAAHMSALGYKRDTTPAMARFARSALLFTHAYTPTPELTGACMTVLTGIGPLRHGYLGRHQGPLPEGYDTLAEVLQKKHYATQAFTESEGLDGDLVFGHDFDRGFESFDTAYDSAQGSAATLKKASAWIDAHTASKFFVFIRLRELRDLHWVERYAPGFVSGTPAPVDVYDSAILYLDRLLGEFQKHVRGVENGKSTCFVLASSHGLDFSAGDPSQPTAKLTDDALHVPLMIYLPALKKVERTHVVGLDDVMPTLLALAQTGLDYVIDGRDAIQDSRDRLAIGMYGDPLVLTYRVDRWRLTWQSGLSPFTRERTSPESVIELCDAVQASKQGFRRNDMAKHPDLVTRYRLRLESYLNESRPGIGGKAPSAGE